MQYRNIAATTITNRTTDIMMKKFLMLYAFLMTALSLFAREDRVSNFEQLMRCPASPKPIWCRIREASV